MTTKPVKYNFVRVHPLDLVYRTKVLPLMVKNRRYIHDDSIPQDIEEYSGWLFNEIKNHPHFYAVYADGSFGGVFMLTDVRGTNSCAVHAIAEPKYWGTHVRDSFKAVLPELFKTFYRIEASVPLYNRAVHKLLEDLGFLKEGIQIGVAFHRGKPTDYTMYGLTRDMNNG